MQRIFDAIEKYHMIEPGMRIVTGVSGGADSLCLLYALSEYRRMVPFDLLAVHVEHGIRGAESLADAAFVEEQCRRFGVLLRVVSVDVPKLAKERRTSLEETARTVRYRAFREALRSGRADVNTEAQDVPCSAEASGSARIAVAHNRGDQAETVLWNLVRGSGLKGLCGMHPARGDIIRPLLFMDRSEIERILLDAGLTWRTDRTNLEQEYTRNKIRLSVIPELERELNGQAAAHMAQAAGRLQQIQDYLERMTQLAKDRCIVREDADICIRLQPFLEEDELIQTELVREALADCRGSLKNIGSIHIGNVQALAKMDCGKELHLPGKVTAIREDGTIRFVAAQRSAADGSRGGGFCKTEQCREVPPSVCFAAGRLRMRTELLENSPEILAQVSEEKKYTKWLSYDIIKGNVCLRTRRTGDYLSVNAQGGTKKLKDYFIDRKVPRNMRDEVLLLADGAHILWAVGYRISEAAKVRPDTKKVLKIQLEESDE